MSVAILGAGPSGLVAAKSALEVGLLPTIFERSNDIGGLWHPEHGSVWTNMSTNLSYFSCMFSDFPWTSPSNAFPNQSELYQYLNLYATKYGLQKFMMFNTEVTNVTRDENNANWQIQYTAECLRKSTVNFKYVIIASGVFSSMATPSFPTNKFTGKIVTSKDYKNSEQAAGKRVVVVGGSFTGVEIANEVAHVAESVTIISQRKFYIIPRFIYDYKKQKPVPVDLYFYKRDESKSGGDLLPEEQNKKRHVWLESISKQSTVSDKLAISKEDFSKPPYVVISDGYLQKVKEMLIDIKNEKIVEMKDGYVYFENGERLCADVVVICIGYRAKLPYFNDDILRTLEYDEGDQLQPLILHEEVFHPSLPNMAFVGMYRGPYFAIMELQARWACMAFKDPGSFYPTLAQMNEGLDRERKIREADPRPQFPHGNYIEYADALASAIGVLPDFENLQKGSLEILELLFHCPVIPSLYRLYGPYNNYEVALQTIRKCLLHI